jgi:hypothetical protein
MAFPGDGWLEGKVDKLAKYLDIGKQFQTYPKI